MSYGTCRDCGRRFWRDEEWKTLCLDCWKARKRAEDGREAVLQTEIAQLRHSLAVAQREAAKAKPLLDRRFLRRAVSLTHPDKHNGSEVAAEVTRRLLSLMQTVD